MNASARMETPDLANEALLDELDAPAVGEGWAGEFGEMPAPKPRRGQEGEEALAALRLLRHVDGMVD